MEVGTRYKKVLVLGLMVLVVVVGLVFGIILIKASIGDGSNEAIDNDNGGSEEIENYDTVIEVFNAEGSASTTVSGSGK